MEDIMADTTKKADNANATKAKRVTVKIPKLRGIDAVQEEFFSVNGKNYIIKRGEEVEIPEEVAEVIRNGEKAEEYAMDYEVAMSKQNKDEALK